MSAYSAFLCLTLSIQFKGLLGYPTGAPLSSEICTTLTPKHGDIKAQNSTSPYNISLDKTMVLPGEEVLLTISGEAFKGFLVQGRRMWGLGGMSAVGYTPVGRFVTCRSMEDRKTMNCGSVVASSITHANNMDKNAIELTWIAPYFRGTYVLLVTIVKDASTFWAAQSSPTLMVVR